MEHRKPRTAMQPGTSIPESQMQDAGDPPGKHGGARAFTTLVAIRTPLMTAENTPGQGRRAAGLPTPRATLRRA
jgi:hypothetical protein